MLKRLIGVTSKYRSTGVIPIVDKMRANRLSWLGRVLRIEETASDKRNGGKKTEKE